MSDSLLIWPIIIKINNIINREGKKASEFSYRKIFNEDSNLGFHKPSKDVCDTCDVHKKRKVLEPLQNKKKETTNNT